MSCYKSYPITIWSPCMFCKFHNQRIEDLASPLEDSINVTTPGFISPETMRLEEAIVHPSLCNISYPYISNSEDDSVKTNINNSIIRKVNQLFTGNIFLPEKFNLEEIAEFYKVPLNEKGILSILFGLYTYREGPHGITKYNSLTIDMETGKSYVFSELFNPKMNYLSVLNEFIFKEIKQKQIPIINEFKGVLDNQQFYLTPFALVIYYRIYEYTPYSYGLFEITIPYGDITELLSPLSPIQKLI
jgi:hypothetical protein